MSESLQEQTTGGALQPEAEESRPAEEQAPVLQGLPPELKDLEGKDLATALAEMAKLKKSYEEAQRLIGRQGEELGTLRQMVRQFAQQYGIPSQYGAPGMPPVMPQAPLPQQPQTQEEEIETVEGLFKTVKRMREELQNISQEKERLKAHIQAQEVKNSVLSKFPDANEYQEEIMALTSMVDPRYLTMPQAWHVVYTVAKSLREATKSFSLPQGFMSAPPPAQPQPAQQIQQNQQPNIPAGEVGMQIRAGGKGPVKIPEEVAKTVKKVARRLNVKPEDLEKFLVEG